jgi:hypothetical protein
MDRHRSDATVCPAGPIGTVARRRISKRETETVASLLAGDPPTTGQPIEWSQLHPTRTATRMTGQAHEAAVATFRQRLTEFQPREIVQRYITSGGCAMVDAEQLAEGAQRISSHFDVHHTSVFVVGSAKLGFSIAPEKRFRAFGEESDIDIAIVSTELYLRIWRQLAALLNADPTFRWNRHNLLKARHLTGWLRPDALPPSSALPLADQWFEFFRELTANQVLGPFKINAGVYFDVDFLESYQELAVALCSQNGVDS